VSPHDRPIAKEVIYATMSSLLQALWNVIVWILVVAAELFVTALIVAPRFVTRKLRSLLHALVRSPQRILRALSPHRGTPRASQGGT
jgi:hypothetical protein